MQSDLQKHICLFFLPLILANILHMAVVKQNIIAVFAKPIAIKWFGYNKTWRGFIVLPLLTALFTTAFNGIFLNGYLQTILAFLLGFGLGFSYMLWELPNSFIKRRLGIANGERSKKMPYLQVFIDKADSLIGVLLFYYLAMPVSIKAILILFTASISIHLLLSYLLVVFRFKKSL
jgi:hypothetical protein